MSSQKPELTPEEQKKKLALIYASLVTVIIFLGWIFYFIGDARKELDRTSDNRVALFGLFENNIGKFADSFVNQFKGLPSKFIASSTNDLIGTTTESTSSATSTNLIISTTTNNF